MVQPPPRPLSSSSSAIPEEEILDKPLHLIGFEYEHISGTKVSGHLKVTRQCCQPFNLLHGGVSAMVSEALASMGACLACSLKRVAGIHVSIDHFKSAQLGDLVYAKATPLSIGKRIQLNSCHLMHLSRAKITFHKEKRIEHGRTESFVKSFPS